MKLYRLQWDRDGRCDLFASLPDNFETMRSNARGVLRFHAIDGFHSINCEARGVTVYSESDGDNGFGPNPPAVDATGFEYANPPDPGDELPDLYPTQHFGASLTISGDAAFLTVDDETDDWGASASLRIPEDSK